MLLSVNDAREKLIAPLLTVSRESLPLIEAAGRILVEPVIATVDLPPFSNSSMDGFAVRAADIRGAAPARPIHLKVVGDIPAGMVVEKLVGPGEAMRIMTGAPLPPGADTVVPVEDTDYGVKDAGVPAPDRVEIHQEKNSGAYVRLAGEDLRRGQHVISAGKPLRPQDVAMLASLGRASVSVYRRPRIAIFSTGDELLPVSAALEPGKIRESNGYALAVQIGSCGATPLNLGIVPDVEQSVRQRLDKAVEEGADLIVTSAGVSVGAYDYVRMVIEAHGALDFWRVNMRPGKPLAFGTYRAVPFVGLPGNPVSAYVGFEVFLRPAIMKMAGNLSWEREVRIGVLAEDVKSDGRESYLRGRIHAGDEFPILSLTGHQGSGNLFSLVQAEALVIIPAGSKRLPAGQKVAYWPIR